VIAHSRSWNPTHPKLDTPGDNYCEDWASQAFYYIYSNSKRQRQLYSVC